MTLMIKYYRNIETVKLIKTRHEEIGYVLRMGEIETDVFFQTRMFGFRNQDVLYMPVTPTIPGCEPPSPSPVPAREIGLKVKTGRL